MVWTAAEHLEKDELDPYLASYTSIKSKDSDLSVEKWNQVLQETMGISLWPEWA